MKGFCVHFYEETRDNHANTTLLWVLVACSEAVCSCSLRYLVKSGEKDPKYFLKTCAENINPLC